MKQFNVMQALYDSEITVRAEPNGCWDNGFRVQIGDDQNGWQEPTIYGWNWDRLMTRLALRVEHMYPDSRFAEQLRAARERQEEVYRSARNLNGGFQAVPWDDISMDGSTVLPRGLYIVRPLIENRKNAGAELIRDAGPPIRLTQDQFKKLDQMPHFDRR